MYRATLHPLESVKVLEQEFTVIQYFELPPQMAVSKQYRYIAVRLYVICGWYLSIYCVSAINFSFTLLHQFSFHILWTKEILGRST
jgi:hypothetical protein